MVYLITYDLNKETKRPPIVADIKDFEGWAKLSESSYAISTSLSVEGVYGKLDKHLDNNDQLYVISLSAPWVGLGQKEVNDWLDKNLSQ